MKLFDENENEIPNKLKCKDCIYCEKVQCGSKYFFYCKLLKSNLTGNGRLKIKYHKLACNNIKTKSPN